MNKLLQALVLVALGLLSQSTLAQTQPVDLSGASFKPQMAVAGKPLQLHGATIRYKAIVKVYALGLYLPPKASRLKAITDLPGPKRVHAVLLRDITGVEFGKSDQESASKEDFMSSITQIARLGEVLSARRQLQESEPFTDAPFFNGVLKL